MEKNNVSSVSWRKKDGQPSERTCEPEDRQDFGRMVYPSGVAAAEKGRLWHRFVTVIRSRRRGAQRSKNFALEWQIMLRMCWKVGERGGRSFLFTKLTFIDVAPETYVIPGK